MTILSTSLQWPSLARDLAVMTVPNSGITSLDEIYRSYGLGPVELKKLLTLPAFQKLFESALEEVKALGSKAGFHYRALALSQSLAEKLFRDAHSDRMKSAEAVRFLELLLKAGGLMDNKENAAVNVQNNIAVTLPYGLKNKKLAHAVVERPENKVIEAAVVA